MHYFQFQSLQIVYGSNLGEHHRAGFTGSQSFTYRCCPFLNKSQACYCMFAELLLHFDSINQDKMFLS